MMASDLKLIAGALEHYANDNPGNSPKEEIERMTELTLYFWAEAEEADRRLERLPVNWEKAAARAAADKKRGH